MLIAKSAAQFYRTIRHEQEAREKLFSERKTPKQAFSFIFFIIILGQIGIITSVIWSSISGNGLLNAIALQGNSGNFLTFEISLIFSCAMFYFEEYGESRPKDLFCLRITYLIISLSIAFLAMINYIYISTQAHDWSCYFITYNIALYIIGIYISYKMYMTFLVTEETATESNERNNTQALDRAESLNETQSLQIGSFEVKL